ncbi:hypothetical protein [Vibrio parahaemolyticus]|uniref:hypothetical protein n=1 Tax=Vibrio parahaemolyticus TaxID=670 RepID=UPI001123F2A8|nr:hypothetical protein [Vibrio parahaemolyticus]EJG1029701.1 hypothetical protein [Vibrio parahaemolyticus]TOA15965.1 hypothetical protein CGK33_13410 [Vibrio parahaemolyticus]
MKTQWPNEKNKEYQDEILNLRKDLIFFIDNYKKELEEQLDLLSNLIIESGVEYNELHSEVRSSIIDVDVNYNTEDKVDLISTWICVLAMVKSPTLNTWLNIKKVFYNSNNINFWLEESILVHTEIHPEDRYSFIALSDTVINSLEENDRSIISERHRGSLENALLYWKETPEKLTEIWWGLRGFDPWSYSSELVVFSVLKTLDNEKFIQRISKFENPYLVDVCLFAIGVDKSYSCWEEIVKLAPLSFEKDGEWNGSVLMPLLLVYAHKGIQQAVYGLPHSNLSPEDEVKAKNEIDELNSSIVTLLAQREDSHPLFARWSTWLMREVMISGSDDQDNVTSVAYRNNSLLKEIGQSVQLSSNFQLSSESVPAWERWVYRAVLALHSYNGFITQQECSDFIDEWSLDFDSWNDDKGAQLIESSRLFNMNSQAVPNNSSHLLAYSIAMSNSPSSNWIKLWNNTRLLREIVEYGDFQDSRIDRYKGSTEAIHLILLGFTIGLSILDQMAQRYIDDGSISKDEILDLYRALFKAANEMREINYFIDIEKWDDALLSLIIRRLHWESGVGNIAIFNLQDTPSFSDLVKQSTYDVVFFWRVIENTLIYQNKLVDRIDLPKQKIIDLVNDIELVKNASDKKFRINSKAIDEFSKLF